MKSHPSPSPSKHIIVINDTAAILSVFRELLEDEGYQVTLDNFVSHDLCSRIETIKALKPDLVILDFIVGGEPLGWQLLQLLKMDRVAAKFPVLICTAAVRQVDELGARLLTMGVEVVLKPFEIEELLGTIARILARNGEPPPV